MVWSDRCFETYFAWTYASEKGFVAGEHLEVPSWFDFKRLSQDDAACIVRKDVWQGQRVIGGAMDDDMKWARLIVERLERGEVCCFSFVKRYSEDEDCSHCSDTIYVFVEACSRFDQPICYDEYGVSNESGKIVLWSFGNDIWPEVMKTIEIDLTADNVANFGGGEDPSGGVGVVE